MLNEIKVSYWGDSHRDTTQFTCLDHSRKRQLKKKLDPPWESNPDPLPWNPASNMYTTYTILSMSIKFKQRYKNYAVLPYFIANYIFKYLSYLRFDSEKHFSIVIVNSDLDCLLFVKKY